MLVGNKKEELKEEKIDKYKDLREERMEIIYDYLELKKQNSHTAYSLSKELDLTLSTVQNLVTNLESDGFIIVEEKIENGRLKKNIRIRKANEIILSDVSENEPNKDDIIERAHEKGYSVWIHKNNGDKYEIKPPK